MDTSTLPTSPPMAWAPFVMRFMTTWESWAGSALTGRGSVDRFTSRRTFLGSETVMKDTIEVVGDSPSQDPQTLQLLGMHFPKIPKVEAAGVTCGGA